MIAICPPPKAQWNDQAQWTEETRWNGLPTTPARTGSLRRIDDIVQELLAGYALTPPVAAAPPPVGIPARVNFPPQADVMPVEMLMAVER